MNAPVRRLSLVVAVLFASLLVSTTLIQYVFAADLNARPDNRRTLLSTFARERGEILVGQTAVAKSVPVDDEYKYQRVYDEPRLYAHVTGSYSFFGASGGLEQAENALLSGSSDKLFYRRVSDLFTGRRAQGANLETTLDPKVQAAAADGLRGIKGAAVALDPKTGAILAMVSNPTYDPNDLASHDLFTGRRAQGANLETTLDPKVQAAAADGLRGIKGAAVALDPKTGAILAMVSNPTYDPNDLASHDLKVVERNSKALNADPDKPTLNRTINELYPPGSVFKVVTAAAALSTGEYDENSMLPGPAVLDLPDTSADLPNHDNRACGSSEEVTMTEALAVSCNTAFAYLGMQIGADALQSQAAKFGFGDALSVPMRVTPSSVPADLNKPQLAQSSIGQYDVQVTPLQMAMVAAGIGNRGTVMKPYLVQSVIGSDLSVIESADAEELSQAVSPEVAAQLTRMMEAVVEDGTGTKAQIPGVDVAGKTGTAQHGEGRKAHAWFISFAPANNPEIAVAVIAEDGGVAGSEAGGGTVAAPIAKQMMEARLNR